MGRAPCCDKATVKKGPWSPEEDAKLKSFIEQHGTGGNWIALPKKIGLRRCGKSCRLRWLNYLRPNLKHGGFSDEEDKFICRMYTAIGSRWSIIASQLAGRTDNDVKNYWNTKLKKKFLGKQRKEYPAPRKQRKAKKAEDDIVAISGQQQQQQQPLDGAGNSFAMPPPLLASQQQIYDLVPPPLQEFQGLGSDDGGHIWSELDEMLRFSWVKLEGADCYYGLGGSSMVNDGSSNYTTEKSENMEEVMSPSVYQNMMRVYDHGMQGFMPAQGAEDAPWHVTMS